MNPAPHGPSVREVAEKLTEAQRRAVCWPMEDNHPQWAGHISCWADQSVADALYDFGLTATHSTLTTLKDLGWRVRAHLLAQEAAGDMKND